MLGCCCPVERNPSLSSPRTRGSCLGNHLREPSTPSPQQQGRQMLGNEAFSLPASSPLLETSTSRPLTRGKAVLSFAPSSTEWREDCGSGAERRRASALPQAPPSRPFPTPSQVVPQKEPVQSLLLKASPLTWPLGWRACCQASHTSLICIGWQRRGVPHLVGGASQRWFSEAGDTRPRQDESRESIPK